MTPQRIQLSRRKGYRKPEGAIVVARPSRWGNPFKVAEAMEAEFAQNEADARSLCVQAFRDWLHGNRWAAGSSPNWEENRHWFLAQMYELAGHDLACWCPLDQPCHADVLLELANPQPSAGGPA